MALPSGRGRLRLRFGLLIFTAVALITLDFRDYGPIETAKVGVRDLLQPAISLGNGVIGAMGDIWSATVGGSRLRKVNAELRAEIDQLRGARISAEADREAYKRLREAVDIDYIDDIDRIAASVIRDDVGNFPDNVFAINRGRRDGVASGMVVVTGAGLAGTVEAVGADQSTVLSVSNPELVISVRLVDTGDVGLGHALEGDHMRFTVDTGLQWADTEESGSLPAIGSAVVTANSSRYPSDIPVGRVADVKSTGAGLVQSVEVELSVDTGDLGFVTVLMAEQRDLLPVGPPSPFVAIPADDSEP